MGVYHLFSNRYWKACPIMRFIHVRFVPKFTTLFFKVASYGRDRIVEERARRFVYSLESPGLCGDQCTKFVISYVTTD